jgi:NADPH:quinone reductase-like Zn-dependent oxidoreductase
MLAAYAVRADAEAPLNALVVGEIDPPHVPEGWVMVQVKAAALNHHDVWSLRGVGLAADRLPMILGCDAAGMTEDGRDVIVHAVINSPDFVGSDTTHDPQRSLLSERYPGTFATQLQVPPANLLDKPPDLSFAESACLPTAWLTAYRMLFGQSGAKPGDTVLIQGAGGGVSTALIALARQGGMRVWVTSRDDARGARAIGLGAHQAFPAGARLPERVDAVMESVGAATWSHSVNVLKPGGTIVICGATSGDNPPKAELTKIYFKPVRVIGSVMGTREELISLTQMLVATGLRPHIDRVLPLTDAVTGFAAMIAGDHFGKIIFEP